MAILLMPTSSSPSPSSGVQLSGTTGSTDALKTVTVSQVQSQSAPVTGTYTPAKPAQHGKPVQPGSATVRLSPTRWRNFQSQCDSSFTVSITHNDTNKITEFEPSSTPAIATLLQDLDRKLSQSLEEGREDRLQLRELLAEVQQLRQEVRQLAKPDRPRVPVSIKKAGQRLRRALNPKG